MSSRQIRQFCALGKPEIELMRIAVNAMGLSARAHDKIPRVARTISDLESCAMIESHHVQEAINYRMLHRDIFSQRASRWFPIGLFNGIAFSGQIAEVHQIVLDDLVQRWRLRNA